MADVRAFVSYANDDDLAASDLKKGLSRFDINVFYAKEDIPHGSMSRNVLIDEIKKCKCFLVLISKNYHMARYTDQEVGMAICHNKKIIPICIDETEPQGFIKDYQYKRYSVVFSDDELKEIAKSISHYTKNDQAVIDFLSQKTYGARSALGLIRTTPKK